MQTGLAGLGGTLHELIQTGRLVNQNEIFMHAESSAQVAGLA